MTNEKKLTHIDLFSGIGGFTLAGEWAGFKTVIFCEKEDFCKKVLKKHWPEIPIIAEIRDFDGKKYQEATLLTGGFPCQPFSVAGQRRGKEDDRYLWPEMLRVISEAKPHWILAENVPGIFRMALDTVLADLEGESYTTGTFIIPACGLNAPHRRNRVWIVANSRCQHGERFENKGELGKPLSNKENAVMPERPIENDESGNAQNAIGTRTRNQNRKIGDQERRISQDRRKGIRQKDGTIGTGRSTSADKYACDSFSNGHSRRHQETRREEREGKQGRMHKSEGTNSNAPDSKSRMSREQTEQKGRENSGRGNIEIASDSQFKRPISGKSQERTRHKKRIFEGNNSNAPDSSRGRQLECLSEREEKGNSCEDDRRNLWQENWYEIATSFCRVDDGVSDRIHRLKALGNAIVPQIAYEILKRIAWIERNE